MGQIILKGNDALGHKNMQHVTDPYILFVIINLYLYESDI